jgi:hypothetical protein
MAAYEKKVRQYSMSMGVVLYVMEKGIMTFGIAP